MARIIREAGPVPLSPLEVELLGAKAKVRDLEEAISKEKEAKRNETPIIKEYRIFPVPPEKNWDECYDDTVEWWRIECTVTNRLEAKEVGHNTDVSGKGMNYLYNTKTGKVIMPSGGGHIFIGGFRGDKNMPLAMAYLGNWITANYPRGGLATEFVREMKELEGKEG